MNLIDRNRHNLRLSVSVGPRGVAFPLVLLVLAFTQLALDTSAVVATEVIAEANTVASVQKYNVVLFVTDDQSPDTGCYGNKAIKTPYLDQLAAEGTCFDRAFCTTASCSASRSVILTGLFNHANGQYGHAHSYHHFKTKSAVKSLPFHLKDAGYRTARVGKFHVAPEEIYEFDNALPGNSRHPVQMAENCSEFIQAENDKPFFLYFCTSDPHRGGGTYPNDPNQPNAFGNQVKPRKGLKKISYDPSKVNVPSFLPDTPVCRSEIAQYYESCSRIDQGLGKLIEILKQAKVYEKTVIIFTADHGMAFPGGKTTVYEGGMRVPYVIKHPELKADSGRSAAMISHVDIAPTILDIAGHKTPQKSFHGRSILPAIQNRQPEKWQKVYASHTFHEITMYYPMRVVRTDRYKLIWNIAHGLPYPFASDLWAAPTWQDIYKQGPDALYGKRTVRDYIHRPKFELFDLVNDPHESQNVANDPSYKQILEQLQNDMKAFQNRSGDPWKLKWKYE